MLDLIVIDGRARGIVTRNLVTGEIDTHLADAVILATGGYGNVYYLSTNAKGSNATAIWRAHKRGALFANPCFTQIHPTCIPVSGEYQSKLTLMSESLRNDGRIWVPQTEGRQAAARSDSGRRTRLLSGAALSELRQSGAARCRLPQREERVRRRPRRWARRARRVSRFLRMRSSGWASRVIRERYGNLFDMYQRITDENPYKVPMRIYPAIHYTMGGLWVDYQLMSTIPGLFVVGEANFSDHGANRLGASALMQGLSRRLLHHSLHDRQLSREQQTRQAWTNRIRRFATRLRACRTDDPEAALDQGQAHGGFVPSRAGQDHVGLLRDGAQRGGLERPSAKSASLREEYWQNVNVPGSGDDLNQSLEKAGRVADFFELAELMCIDALRSK